MASQTPFYKTHCYKNKQGKKQWSWKAYGRNGEVVAAGRGLDKEPDDKYMARLSEIISKVKKHINKPKSK